MNIMFDNCYNGIEFEMLQDSLLQRKHLTSHRRIHEDIDLEVRL